MTDGKNIVLYIYQ